MGQETLIFIDDTDKTDANITAKSFAHEDVRYRTYYNTIGASLVAKYLSSEGIDTKGCTGLHSIKKILEELDISDIILPNIRMDVRVIFDENAIFIPKSHFQYNVVPDIYIVVKPSKDFSNVEILGFFEPGLINKNNANNDYYFIEKEKLTSGENLIEYIKTHNNNSFRNLSNEELEAFEQIIMKFSDNDIEDSEKKFLIQQLILSSELREKFIEYENFEKLSYKAMTDPMIDVPELPQDTVAVDEFEIFDAQPIEQSEPIAEEIQPQIETEKIEPIINSEESETVENIEPASEITNEEPADNIDNVLDGIDVIDENVLGNVSEIADLAGAEAGFEAVNTVSDTMENILFDNETVDAVNNVDNTENIDSQEPSAEPIEEPVIENIEPQGEVIEPLNIEENTETIEEPKIETLEQIEVKENWTADNNMLSFDDVIVPENIDQPEVIEETSDNKLSFDTIEAPELNITEENIAEDANMLSFDDIVAPELEKPQEAEQSDNILSFDTIEAPETVVSAEEPKVEPTLSFDDIIAPELEVAQDAPANDNLLSFGDIQMPEAEETNNTENQEVTPIANEIPEISNEIPEQTFEEPQNQEFTVQDEPEFAIIDDSSFITEDNSDEIKQDDASVIEMFDAPKDDETESIEDQRAESFGKNLLENLNEESFDNISIESADTSGESDEAISSDSLLSQIDDVLNASQTTNDVENGVNENKLDVLYTEENKQNADMEEISNLNENKEYGEHEQDSPVPGGALFKQNSPSNKKTLVAAAILVAIIAGLSASVFFKPKNNATANIEQPVNNETSVQQTGEAPVQATETTDNILEANAPQEIKTEQTQQVDKSAVQEMKNTGKSTNKPTASMSVTKIVWDVPSSVSTNPKMQTFLRTIGKSVKLSLSTDLLLVSEYAYTNSVKVSIPINSDGNIGTAQITSSSGSTEIDNIVLQSVNDTLNVIKPPSDALQGQSAQLTLIIYF